jgi:hypothetical protein
MRTSTSLKLFAFIVLGASMMYGQASRTWVSGVGDDANPCSRTAPCKTFAGAISKTAAGGEIDALDPGGFGAVTITKAITIDGGGGQVASVLVLGTNGIVVAAGANDVVILRNLRINGVSSGLNGIQFNSGKDLNVENCYIFGFTQNGINITLNQSSQASVHIINSVVKNNTGVGIRATNAQSPAVQVGIDHSDIMLSATGVEAAQHSRVRVNSSIIQHASSQGGLADDAVSGDAILNITNSDISFNGNGVTAGPGAGVTAVVVAYSSVTYNSGAAFNAAGAGNFSYSNTNRVSSNGGGNGTFTSIPLLP